MTTTVIRGEGCALLVEGHITESGGLQVEFVSGVTVNLAHVEKLLGVAIGDPEEAQILIRDTNRHWQWVLCKGDYHLKPNPHDILGVWLYHAPTDFKDGMVKFDTDQRHSSAPCVIHRNDYLRTLAQHGKFELGLIAHAGIRTWRTPLEITLRPTPTSQTTDTDT